MANVNQGVNMPSIKQKDIDTVKKHNKPKPKPKPKKEDRNMDFPMGNGLADAARRKLQGRQKQLDEYEQMLGIGR